VQGNLRFLAGFVEMSAAGEAYRFVSGESVTESIDTYYANSPLPTGFGNIDSFTYHVAREGSAAGTEANIAIVAIVLPFAIKWPGVAPRLVKRPVTAAEAEFESFRALGRGHPEEFLRGEAPYKVSPAVKAVGDDVTRFLGKDARVITNPAGDTIFLSKDGLRRVRFDINNPSPHLNPHSHVEINVNGKWVKSGPLYPSDVTPK
jgi:hypothetical protein